MKYDVILIGGGISSLMCAYNIMLESDKTVLILEQGKNITERQCPILNKKSDRCLNCSSCAIMEGMSGAGAFSDGKYNLTTEYGGWLGDFVDNKELNDLMNECDKILMKFGAPEKVFLPNDDLKKLCMQYDLHMLQGKVKHFGTDNNLIIMNKFIEHLRSKGITILTNTKVIDVDIKTKEVKYTLYGKEHVDIGNNVVFAVGRVGSSFFKDWCFKNNIGMKNRQVDIGVRVELPWEIWSHFSEKIYEPKILYRSKQYNDVTRMFCFNERGQVVMENSNGVKTVNGHAYSEEAKKSANSNFALLSTINFTDPFNAPIEYAKDIAALSNKISGDSVLVQRYGDLLAGQRTTYQRLALSRTKPTLNAVPGDLSLCIPKRQLDNIIETIQVLDKIAPGTANYDTLLYGVECKYYSSRPVMNDFSLNGCSDIYAIGDGAGVTRSLSQAAANGLYIGRKIGNK